MRWIFMAVTGHALGRARGELGGELLHLEGEAHREIAVKAAVPVGLAAAGVPAQLGHHRRAAGVEAPALALLEVAGRPGVGALAIAAALLALALDVDDLV
ncbi:MAG TPA: hypothetical protein VN914_04070, partial [Polyangia bacterium]|nr:hypothetical protein [Polyangia bacterium]